MSSSRSAPQSPTSPESLFSMCRPMHRTIGRSSPSSPRPIPSRTPRLLVCSARIASSIFEPTAASIHESARPTSYRSSRWKARRWTTASRWPGRWASASAASCTFPSTCTSARLRDPTVRIWPTSGAASSRGCATRSGPTRNVRPILAPQSCIPARAPSQSVHAPFWWRTTFISDRRATSLSPKTSPRRFGGLPAGCATSRHSDSMSTDKHKCP